MKYLRISVLAIGVAALMALVVTNASATVLDGPEGMLTPGTESTAQSEGHVVLDSPIGKIECNSTAAGTSSNTGSSTETVSGKIESLTFTGCTNSAVVKVLSSGSTEIHTAETTSNNNGTLTTSGTEVTVEQAGFHCIYKSGNTDIGLVTGSATTGGKATLELNATFPRTGGRSGAFCGLSAPLTGSYVITSPSTVNVT